MTTLALYILNHFEFSFSTRDDAEEIYNEDADYVTSRMLTDGITHAKGDVKKFLEWVDEDSNFTQEAISMFHKILDSYVMDTKALFTRYNLVSGLVTNNATGTGTNTETGTSSSEEDEADAELFNLGNKTASKINVKIKSPAETEQELINIVNS